MVEDTDAFHCHIAAETDTDQGEACPQRQAKRYSSSMYPSGLAISIVGTPLHKQENMKFVIHTPPSYIIIYIIVL